MHIISLETYQGPDLHAAFRQAGHTCDVVHNESQCIRACRRSRPDAILVDLEADHVDGGELIRAISDQCPAVQLIAVSAQDDDEVLERVFRDGAAAYLLKPVRAETLTKVAAQLAPREEPITAERAPEPARVRPRALELIPV